jgi:hypothetical protein
MIGKKDFIFLYLMLFFVIIFFSFLYIMFVLDIRFPLSDFFFKEKNLEVVSKIIYLEGNDIYFTAKGGNRSRVDSNSGIKSDIIVETGKNSYVGFYIKDQGYYFMYPETSIYIKKIEQYITEKSIKESLINLEKGRIYMNINFYSINSYLAVETQDCYCEMNESGILFDKTKDFETKIVCYSGKANYRAYSEKFNFFEENKNILITNSIERLINSSNTLVKGRYAVINVTYQNKLDNILNRLYESKNTNLINKDYISSFLKIPDFEMNAGEKAKYVIPDFDIIKYNLNEKGYVEITTPGDSDVEFNNKRLERNTKYSFFLETGKYTFFQDLGYSRVLYNVLINDNDHKGIQIRNISGINGVYLNNVKSPFKTEQYVNTGNIPDFNNSLLLKIANNRGEVKTVGLTADMNLKNLYFLSYDAVISDELVPTSNAVYLNSRAFKLYRVNLEKPDLTLTFRNPVKGDVFYFIASFEEMYINDL